MHDPIALTAELLREFTRQAGEAADKLQGAWQEPTGCSLRAAVWREDRAVLYRYLPLPFVRATTAAPLVICYALVNRPYVLDLQSECSLIRSLLAAGLDVYLIEWQAPMEADSQLALVDYIERFLGGAVRYLRASLGFESVNLLGVCQGGTFSLCYAALHPGEIRNLITMVTPVDFQTPDNLLSQWARGLDTELIRSAGNLSGQLLAGLFLSLRPFRHLHQKYVELLGHLADARAVQQFVRLERWVFDSPDQAATAFAQFVRWFYQENRLIRGTLDLGGRTVELGRIHQPVLNIYATQDHIVPPSASMPLQRYIASRDYREYAVETGHIGMYVSQRARITVPATITAWLRERS